LGSGKEKQLSGTAALVMFATLLSRITGFLRNVLISSIMSPKGYSDEFWVAFSLPDLAFDLLIGGAIAAAIIPILASSLSKGEEREGWKAVGTFINVTVIAVIFVEILFFIRTPFFVSIVAKGYQEGTEQFRLTVKLTRILLPSAVFMILAGQSNGILNAYNKFAAASFGPVIYNMCVIISIVIFGGKSAELTSWGVLASSVVYFILQLSFTWKHFKFYRVKLYIKNETFKKLIRLAVPSLAASTVVQINTIICKSFSTEFAQNSVTVMNNANRTWQLPLGIFAQSMGVAILPTLSTRFAEERNDDYKRVLYKGLRTVMLLCIPSTMVLMLLSRQIMQILFGWDSVSYRSSVFNGMALLAYAPALLFQSVVVILNRAFYSIQNTKIPLYSGVGTIAINLLANIYFINYTNLEAIGTALSYVIAVTVNAFLLIILFSGKTGMELIPDNFFFILKTVVATIASGIVLWLLIRLIPFPWEETFSIGKKFMEILVLGIQLFISFIVFVIVSLFLKIDEVRNFAGSILVRIKKQMPAK
jgi:putative peptidoglycan lipid II flippase